MEEQLNEVKDDGQVKECLAKKTFESSQLFSPVEGKPMQFAIIMECLSNFEVNRTVKRIKEKGGEFMGTDPKDNQYINLASTKFKPLPGQIVFDIKYVKECAKKNQVLTLEDFQISHEKPLCSDRHTQYNPLEEEKCKHFQSAEEVLKTLLTHGKS